MAIGFYIGNWESIPNCCGVVELGDITVIKGKKENIQKIFKNYYRAATYGLIVEDDQDVVKEVTNWIHKSASTRSAAFYQIWFAAEGIYGDDDDIDTSIEAGSYDEYHADELRKIVQQFPNVVKLGEAHNPNSGNKIDGYLWERF